MSVILSVDQSTAGTKGLVWGLDGRLLGRADIPHRQITNEAGWVEHDPMEIIANVPTAAGLALQKAGAAPGDVAVIGLSNQRETAVCWNRQTGLPLYNAIVWQCARAAAITDGMAQKGLDKLVWDVTGLELSPYFSAAKFAWMLQNVPGAAKAAKDGTLCCGTVDSWLLFKLCGQFKTDYSNASRTQLLNLDTLCWDETAAEAFGIPMGSLPRICDSDSLFGTTDLGGLLPAPIPVHGVLGDSHAALFGNRCWQPYTAKATYGTGSSVMMNAGDKRPAPQHGVVTSLAWGMGGKVTYVLEGNINYTGAVTKWLVEDIGLLESPKEAGAVAQSVPDTQGVYLVPAFSGLSAPYFNNNARAAILGMGRGTQKAHLVRAGEECIAYQIKDVAEAMNRGSARPLAGLCVDGGPTRDAFLMQFQADMLGIPITINHTEELSGMGAAFCAAMGSGVAGEEALFQNQQFRTVQPNMPPARREALYAGWKAAIQTINQ